MISIYTAAVERSQINYIQKTFHHPHWKNSYTTALHRMKTHRTIQNTMLPARMTKYTAAIQEYLSRAGHATNVDILRELHHRYPGLSATTIHRITARLHTQKKIQRILLTPDAAMHYDSNVGLHDHFYCTRCRVMRDITISPDIFSALQQAVDEHHLNGRLVLTGICKQCQSKINT